MADKCTVIIKRQITPYKKGKRPEKMLEKKKDIWMTNISMKKSTQHH